MFASAFVTYYYEYTGFTASSDPGMSFQSTLVYIGQNATLFNSATTLLALASLLFIPAFVSLLVALRKSSFGTALAGSTFAIAGLGVILSNVSLAYGQVQEAVTWNGGCSPCGSTPVTAAAGMSSFGIASEFGLLVLFAGVAIIGAAMLMGHGFGRAAGSLGVIAGLFGVIWNFAVGPLGATYINLNIPSPLDTVVYMVPYFLLLVWLALLGPKMMKGQLS